MILCRASLPAFAVVAGATFTRLGDLGSRFFHQDEATHAWMSYELARGAGYHYDPVYHGPFLYHLEALVFTLVGTGDLQARLVPALAGVVLVGLLCWWLKRHTDSRTALVAGALAVASPTLTYYSRFNHHDAIIAALTVVVVTASFEYDDVGLIWLAGASALAIATKPNAYFFIGALAMYFLARAAYGRLHGETLRPLTRLRQQPEYLALAAGVGMVLLAFLYATTVIYFVRASGQSILEAVTSTATMALVGTFEYWWTAHQTARLGGPAYYYVPLLAIYEPLILVGAPFALLWFMRGRRRFTVTALALGAAAWMGARLLTSPTVSPYPPSAWQIAAAAVWTLAGFWAVVSLWQDRRDYLACWVFVGVVQVVLYSWANEKVPWLLVHIVLPWIVVVAAFLTDVWRETGRGALRAGLVAVVLVFEAFTLRASWIVNTRNRSEVAEPLVQLEYAPATADVQRQTAGLMDAAAGSLRIAIEPQVQWPFPWYFRDYDVTYLPQPVETASSADILITGDRPLPPALAPHFEGSRLPYVRWTDWADQMRKGDLTGLARFAMHHDRWGPEGGRWFRVWTRVPASRDPQASLTPDTGTPRP
jgi:uncharacterized protein (TIGR03663 family)